MSTEVNVRVMITRGDVVVKFSGSPDSVIKSIVKFVKNQLPTLNLGKEISLSYSVSDIMRVYSDLIKITPEGPRVVLQQDKNGIKRFSDKEIIGLHLLAARIVKDQEDLQQEGIQVSEIQHTTELNQKSISSRLSEMIKAGYVKKENRFDETESVIYRITTGGIHWLTTAVRKKKDRDIAQQ
jgi:DNA-binding PadR family transcriptional regulator